MKLEEKRKKKEIIKIKNISNEPKNSQDIIEEMKYKYRILNKYLKLEDLKSKEKKLRFQDELTADTNEKPAFLFMRNESKTEIGYKPVTTFCDKYRPKEFSSLYRKYIDLNGFKNEKMKLKTETEMYPSNFEDIMSKIELTDILNNIKTNRYNIAKNLISIKHHMNTEENNYKQSNLLLSRNINNTFKTKKKNLLKTKKNKNHTFSALNNKNKDFFSNKNDLCTEVKKIKLKKRPTTSKYNRKYYIDNNINNNENYGKGIDYSFIKNQEGKDVQLNNSKNSNQYRNRNSSFNKFNKNLSCLTTTFKSYSRSLSKQGYKKNEGLLQKIEKQVLNPDSFFFNLNNEKTEFKTTKQIINRILNDGNIIDNYIKSGGQVKEEVLHKIDREEILLKLAERLRKNRNKIKKIKLDKRPELEDDQYLDLEDEQIFKIKLSKIENKYAKEFFREVYQQLLSEKRLLNKREKNDIVDVKEEKKKKKRMQKEFKKDAYKKMLIMNDNIITEKDDKIIIDEQRKMFDYYGNLDGLEWLINKRHIINFRSKPAGAYRSKKKPKLEITYDN